MNDCIAGIAGRVQNFQARRAAPCLFRQLAAIQPGQADIGEQQRYAWMLVEDTQSRLRLSRLKDIIAEGLQCLGSIEPHTFVIFDQQHALPTVAWVRCRMVGHCLRLVRLRVARQVDLDRGSVTELAVKLDVAARTA